MDLYIEETAKLLSKRGQYAYNQYDFLHANLANVWSNTYDPKTNPKGIVNLGTAENRLMCQEVEDKLKDLFKFSETKHQHYFNYSGVAELKESIFNFFRNYLDICEDITQDQFSVHSGSAACLDSLSHALFDPGDIYLSPTPCYARIYTNLNCRSLAQPVPLDLSNKPDKDGKTFQLSGEILEQKILELKEQDKIVKGLVLINPHNPLGDVYSPHLMMNLLHICHKYEMHVIIDEVYLMSLKNTTVKPTSVMSLQDIPDPMRTHVVYALSKDLGLPGLRIGIIHSRNPALHKILHDFATFNSVPAVVQTAIASLLNDTNWLDNEYFPLYEKKLKRNHEIAVDMLATIDVNVRLSEGGLFIWVSLTNFLPEVSFKAEMDLFFELMNYGVYTIPGSQLKCVDPGWYRIVISTREDLLIKGMSRITEVLQNKQKNNSSSESDSRCILE